MCSGSFTFSQRDVFLIPGQQEEDDDEDKEEGPDGFVGVSHLFKVTYRFFCYIYIKQFVWVLY